MNYFIQGDAANADKIKAAFEKLGINVLDFGFADRTVVYCSIGGCVQYLPYSINLMNILYDHPDYKELELPVEPKFRVGDSLQSGSYWAKIRRIDAENRRYICDFDNVIPFEEQEFWSLVPNSKPHYDIANFKPRQWVLVRDCDNQVWGLSMFSHRDMGCYICLNREDFTQCIPFEGNEKLLGTTEPCDEGFINW